MTTSANLKTTTTPDEVAAVVENVREKPYSLVAGGVRVMDAEKHRPEADVIDEPAQLEVAEPVPVVGDGCECWVVPERLWTTHYGAVEPGSQTEYNPDCPKHGEPAQPDEPTEFGARVTVTTPDGEVERWLRADAGELPWHADPHLGDLWEDWRDFTQRGRVSLGWDD